MIPCGGTHVPDIALLGSVRVEYRPTAEGFEVKAVIRDSVLLQKGPQVFWCILHLANTSLLSYVSECYSVR